MDRELAGSCHYVAEVGYRSVTEFNSSFCRKETCSVWFLWEPRGYIANVVFGWEPRIGRADFENAGGKWKVNRVEPDTKLDG